MTAQILLTFRILELMLSMLMFLELISSLAALVLSDLRGLR